MLLKMSGFHYFNSKMLLHCIQYLFFFIHEFNNGHLHSFPIVAITNGGTISTELLIPFIMILFPLELYPVVEFLHQMVAQLTLHT